MLDKKYDANLKEQKWLNYWKENKIYEFIPDKREVFSIDTPPPTVNGKIHIGHIFSYSQTEMIARYKRLRGYNIFYPFGFDDNGLPSERLVEKEQGKRAHEIGREEFSKLCYETTDKYESEFQELFSKMGVSTDWNIHYKTVSPSTIKISQASFLDLAHKGHCYHRESPALWCNECLTSIAQAELETKTIKTTFNYINFKTVETNEEFTIATTRPELLPAIVSVFVNPNDELHKSLIGKTAHIPIINIDVPIMADEKVDSSKGTGIVMCCTFGDQTDIEWWKKYNLPLKYIFTTDGRIIDNIPNYGGMKIKDARKQIIEDLTEAGFVVKVEELEHEVQTHERCGKEVEYAVMKQWFIDIMNHKEDFLRIGNEIKWYPDYMHTRYDEWVNNIMWDWCISRQRYFGVPFPVWYCKECGEPIFADSKDLPVNPLVDKPHIDCCPKCGSTDFIPETDVMDTWATSSITPLINMKYGETDNYESFLKPMSIRTNASEIIRTWDFYTIVKSFYHFGIRPWDNVMISGFVMASKGEKISKSKGNSKVEPIDLINTYSADVIRYWAGTGRLGTDIVYSEETLQRGRKLVTKIWNVSKFIEMHLQDYVDKEFDDFEYIDKWILGSFREMEEGFIKYLDEYEVGLALNLIEKFFWNFCDNYIEIVKHRLYRPEEFGEKARYSGQKTIYILLYKLLQDFSIYFPFITEEIYQELYHDEKSIHKTLIKSLDFRFSDEIKNGNKIIDIISEARGEKTNNNVSLKTPIKTLELNVNKELEDAINKSIKDFKATLFIKDLKMNEVKDNYKISKIELEIVDENL
ncbi:MAG: valine--tRNA ligase [Clostridium sp.]|nr:valine--tRNA ligase [Clostridium sp.]MCM1444493.1 valine--tRNA ligase [Candidatus Amulumruptor caecigallinarius]